MKNLNDLLDNCFGGNKETIKRNIKKKTNGYRKQRGFYINKDECKDLIISLNYAINSIKNKKDVVEKSENSTRYEHYKRWTSLRTKIRNKLEGNIDG